MRYALCVMRYALLKKPYKGYIFSYEIKNS